MNMMLRCAHVASAVFRRWGWRDLNPQGLLHTLLKRTRMPVPPHPLVFSVVLQTIPKIHVPCEFVALLSHRRLQSSRAVNDFGFTRVYPAQFCERIGCPIS